MLAILDDWAAQYKMRWAPTKCVVLQEAVPEQQTSFILDKTKLQTATIGKYLGIPAIWQATENIGFIDRIQTAVNRVID